VAGVLNAASGPLERTAMNHIASQDPRLASTIKAQMFPFEDFIKVDNYGMQKVLARVTNEDLVLALRTAGEGLRRHFLRNLSSENAAALRRTIENPGPLRVSDMEAAQKRLSNIARELAERGELIVLEKRK
jgi:flagellar motor switch protein FliG